LTELPQLRAYLKVVGDDTSLNHDEKLKRVHAILYGWNGSKLNMDLVEAEKNKNGN